MKRITVFLLSLAMLLSQSVYVLAQDTENEDLYAKLQALDCLWDAEKYEPSKNVTRGEFASLLNKLTNGNLQSDKNRTSDMVKTEDKFYEEVQKAVSRGLMRVYDDGSFAPGKNISLDDVCYGFVNLLGYGKMAEKAGAFPKGYESMAEEIGILKGIKGDYANYVNGDNMLKIIDNALECDMMVLRYNGAKLEYVIENDTNLLKNRLSVYKEKGRITANEYSGILGGGVGEGNFEIGGKIMSVGKTDAAMLLGYKAEVYYRDNDGEYEALWIDLKDNSELFIYAEDIKDYSDRTIKYDNGKQIKKANISQKAKVIYNGVAVSEYGRDDIMIKTGDITLLKESGASEYDIVIIASYDNYVVENADFDKCVIYDKLGRKFTWQESAKLLFYSDNFLKKEKEDVKSNTVLSIAKSKDGSLVTFVISSNSIEGTIESIDYDDGTLSAEISGKSYDFDGYYLNNRDAVTVGAKGKFYLDMDGKIVYFNAYSYGKWVAAYAIKKYCDDNGDYYIRYFDGEVKESKIADSFKADGVRFSKDEAQTAVSADKFMLFKLNSNGEIYDIDYPSDGKSGKFENENSLRTMSVITEKTWYRPNNVSFAKRFLMNSDTKVYVLPENKSDYDKYELSGIAKFVSRTYSGISAYCIGDGAEYAQYVVYDMGKDAVEITNDAQFCILKGISEALDENDEIVRVMEYYTQSGVLQKTVFSDNVDTSLLECGDILQLSAGDDGRIEKVNLSFDYSTKTMGDGSKTNYITSYYTHAYRRINKTLFMSNGNDDVKDVYKLETVPVNCSVFVFDTKKKILATASAFDIIDWERNNTDYTEFFIRFYYDDPQVIFIWE